MVRSFAVALVFLEVHMVGGVTGWDTMGEGVTETIVWMCVAFSLLTANIALQWQDFSRVQPVTAKRQILLRESKGELLGESAPG